MVTTEVGEHRDAEVDARRPGAARGRATRPPSRRRSRPRRRTAPGRLQVGRLGSRAGPGQRADHPDRADRRRARIEPRIETTVVLPLVPVTPTIASRSDGRPATSAAARAIAARMSATIELRDVDVELTLAQQRRGARCDRRGGEVVAVDVGAGDAAEQRTGTNRPRVVGHGGHPDRRIAGDAGVEHRSERRNGDLLLTHGRRPFLSFDLLLALSRAVWFQDAPLDAHCRASPVIRPDRPGGAGSLPGNRGRRGRAGGGGVRPRLAPFGEALTIVAWSEPVAATAAPAVAGAARSGRSGLVPGVVGTVVGAVPAAGVEAVVAVGAIPSSRMASRERSEKIGPAVRLPLEPGGVSWSITVIETCGLSTGRSR